MEKAAKDAVLFVAVAVHGFMASKKDGKFDLADLPNLMPLIQSAGPLFAEAGQILPSLQGVSGADIVEIGDLIRVQIPELADASNVIVKVRAVLALLVAGRDCFEAFAGAKAVPPLVAVAFAKPNG